MSDHLPWFKFFCADFLASTAHLSCEEHGAYVLLMTHYWRTGGLPTEDDRLGRIALSLPEAWQRMAPAVLPFFDRVDDNLRHPELDALRSEAQAQYDQKVAASLKGVAARKGGQPSGQPSGAPGGQQKIEERKQEKKDSCRVAKATATEEDRFDEFWVAYPKREGPNPKAPAAKKFAKLVRSGTSADDIIAGAKRCAAEARKSGKENTPFIPMAVTWLNQDRWEDVPARAAEAGPAPAPPKHGDLVADGKTYLAADTPEWDAWSSYYRQHGDERGRHLAPPRLFYGGCKFPARWPPGHTVH